MPAGEPIFHTVAAKGVSVTPLQLDLTAHHTLDPLSAWLAHEHPQLGIGMTSPRTRTRMVDRLREKGITDARVLAAMAELPRHLFVENALAHRAYDDDALPIGHGQTISQPFTVARMTELLLNGKSPRKILEIGTGCGYQTAVLTKLFPEVYSIERIAALLDRARANLRAVKRRCVRGYNMATAIWAAGSRPF